MMTWEEIKRLFLANLHLLTPLDKMTVIRDLCGIQAQVMTISAGGHRAEGGATVERTFRPRIRISRA